MSQQPAYEWCWPGARWWRCDLHVHTPASFDYTKRDSATYLAWAKGVVAAGIDVVAVTDHNSMASNALKRRPRDWVSRFCRAWS